MKNVKWTKFLLHTFLEESGIEENAKMGSEKAIRQERILRMRFAEMTLTQMADVLNLSKDQVSKDIAELRKIYDAVQKDSILLPPSRMSQKEKEMDEN